MRNSSIKHTSRFVHPASIAAAGVALAACSGSAAAPSPDIGTTTQAVKPVTIDTRRSLVVTEQPILDRFPLKRVLDQLVAQSGVPGLTSLDLFHQWWDTQNPGPGLGLGAHCDDTVDPALGPVLNGFPYPCRPAPSEGSQATCDPFTDPNSPCAYIPVGLFNRFDLAPEDGATCGEHRIVYAKRTGVTSTNDRNFLIFEAALLNPHPQQGIKGCQQIVDTWGELTGEANIASRADALESFYFEGQGVVPAVVSVGNYGDNALGAGQIRTNQFVNATTGWSLREFKLRRTCSGDQCSALRFVPVTDKDNPYGPEFDSSLPFAAFQTFFPTQTATLAGATLPDVDMDITDVFNSGHSQASGAGNVNQNYVLQLGPGPSTLRSAIQSELTGMGSTLTPDDIARRAMTQACAGCHRLTNSASLGGGLVWPPSLGFTHVAENLTEVVDGVTRFVISPALVDAFLPHRKNVLEEFLNNRPHPSKGPHVPLKGSHSHG
jgi:hypothetical protein